jgi:hypothetical protein
MVIHHVKVDQVSPRSLDSADFLAQASEIGRQNAGGDPE